MLHQTACMAWENRPMALQGGREAVYQLTLAGGPDANC